MESAGMPAAGKDVGLPSLHRWEMVRLTGMRFSTIKFYSELGIIPYEPKDIKLTKYYNRGLTVKLLNEIKRLREKGLSIEQIKEKLIFNKEA